MVKPLATALIAAAAVLGAGAAHAGQVSWSVGINVPVVGAVVSNAPYYAPVPVYMPAPPVYVAAPVYRVAPPVAYYYPRYGAYYRPVPIAYPRYYPGHHHHGQPQWNDRGWRHD